MYEGTGWGREQFLDDWSVIEETQNATTLEGSPVAAAIVKFMEVPSHYEGPAGDLLEKLKETAEDMGLNPQYNKAFPQASNWVWKRIKPVKPTLDGYGIQADQVDRGRGKAKRMVIVLDRTARGGASNGGSGDSKNESTGPTDLAQESRETRLLEECPCETGLSAVYSATGACPFSPASSPGGHLRTSLPR